MLEVKLSFSEKPDFVRQVLYYTRLCIDKYYTRPLHQKEGHKQIGKVAHYILIKLSPSLIHTNTISSLKVYTETTNRLVSVLLIHQSEADGGFRIMPIIKKLQPGMAMLISTLQDSKAGRFMTLRSAWAIGCLKAKMI